MRADERLVWDRPIVAHGAAPLQLADAEDEARSQQVRRVTLIDLKKFVDLWTEHYSRLDKRARLRLPLEPIYFLAPQG